MNRNFVESQNLRNQPYALFSHGLCEAPLVEGGPADQKGLLCCSPLLLNSIFCFYCMLSRQAHAMGDDIFGNNVDDFDQNLSISHHHHHQNAYVSADELEQEGCCRRCCTRLPPSAHWTCLSAVAIDIASIAAAVLNLDMIYGIPFSGIMMQALYTRFLVRRRLGLSTETAQDLFAASFAVPCSVAQSHIEIELRKNRLPQEAKYEGLICGTWSLQRRAMPSTME